MKNYKKLLLAIPVALFVLLFFALLLHVFASDTTRELEELHSQSIEVEMQIKQSKETIERLELELAEEKNSLEEYRNQRETLKQKIDSTINQNLTKEPPKEALSFTPVCEKISVGEDSPQHEMVEYALEISNNNKDFLFTLEAENGAWDMQAVNYNTNGTYDKGLCQLNSQYHLPFIQSEDFKNWKSQINYCHEVFQKAVNSGRITTTFYGYNRRFERSNGKYECE